MEFARKNVFCDVLRILRTSGAAVAAVFNGGFNALLSAYPKDTLVIYMVFPNPVADLSSCPFVIG